MRQAQIFVDGIKAGVLKELDNQQYRFQYDENYQGAPVSLTMPVALKAFNYESFPPFFDGLLPEGIMLEALIRQKKIDKNDYLSQLIAVGKDVVGFVTIEACL